MRPRSCNHGGCPATTLIARLYQELKSMARVARIVREECELSRETRPTNLMARSLEKTCIQEIAIERLDRVASGEPAKQ